MVSFFQRKTFCLITGGSRGLGKGLANVFASKFAHGSVLVLLARNENRLKSVKSKINTSRPDLKVFIWLADLCKTDAGYFERQFADLFQDNGLTASDFPQCLLIHNAFDHGNVKVKMTEQCDKTHFQDYWALSLTSVILLNSVFFGSIFSKSVTPHRHVIQISSILSGVSLKSLGAYCCAKAARVMLFRVLALEEPEVRVLSYDPGLLPTDLLEQAIQETYDEDTIQFFKEYRKEIQTCEQSARKLASLFYRSEFKSGSHVSCKDVDEDGNLIDESLKEIN